MASLWRKILLALGLAHGGVAAATTDAPRSPPYAPYASAAANDIYNLLFFDTPLSSAPAAGEPAWMGTLRSEPLDLAGLQALADDASQEGRVRFAAFQRLRAAGRTVPRGVLLGVVVEVPLEGGLDSLAAYSDGSVRYINQGGAMLFVEQDAALSSLAQKLMEAARPLVAAIGPSDQPRRPPPSGETVRMSFLVSDGLYFGEAPFAVLQQDPMAAPVVSAATELLLAVVDRQDEAKPVP
jgi:hypothetical protein